MCRNSLFHDYFLKTVKHRSWVQDPKWTSPGPFLAIFGLEPYCGLSVEYCSANGQVPTVAEVIQTQVCSLNIKTEI